MVDSSRPDSWQAAGAYDAFMGRWSRLVAADFVAGLARPPGGHWVDVGCGTGALLDAVAALAAPASVVGVDPSPGFVAQVAGGARSIGSIEPGGSAGPARPTGPTGLTGATGQTARIGRVVGDARAVPLAGGRWSAVVSGLALNFVPDPRRALAEFARLAAPGGVIACYVWDYVDGMGMLRAFWDAAVELEPGTAAMDEGRRFPLCQPEPLVELWRGAGLTGVALRPIEITMLFANFDDFWEPFLGGQGPAPGYVAALPAADREALGGRLRERLPAEPDGTIRLPARAWSVAGTRP